MNPKISIVVPVYNSNKYLDRCIKSLISQTFQDIEIILIDDGSTDGSSLKCDKWAEQDSRIRVLHKINEGQTLARLTGVLISKAEYVSFVDSDDWVESDLYNFFYEIVSKDKVDLVITDHYVDFSDKTEKYSNCVEEGKYDRQKIDKEIIPVCITTGKFFEWGIYPSLCDKLFLRNKLLELQMKVPLDIIMGEDAAVAIPYLVSSNTLYISHNSFYHYEQHMKSTVRKIPSADYIAGFRKLYFYLKTETKLYNQCIRKQLEDYLLFITIPRITSLMNNYFDNYVMFPFVKVKKGCNVILYGAGIFGINMRDFLLKTKFCNLIAVIDRNYDCYEDEMDIKSPDAILNINKNAFDYVAITVMDRATQKKIEKFLIECSVPHEKIAFPDSKWQISWMNKNIF